jgi:hypothetical protein
MIKFSKENLDLIIGSRHPMTEFIILKDLHTGEFVLDNYIVEGTHYMGCLSFLVSELIEIGTQIFADKVLNLIPRRLMSYDQISEVCGSSIAKGLYFNNDVYKPLIIEGKNNKKVQKKLFDRDVVLEYCSEHQDVLSESGKRFYNSRKETYRSDKCIVLNKSMLDTINTPQTSINGMLEIPFE